ncbi:ATP-binding protein (plasmid) [Halococcus dombrowskii]|uniref:ATP-binding protein n=1 Tax=Halococcus dombrowskii TaxID=179637 RepID=A0AAV3SFU4_HALDO|nr:ATP-binding protein [Halococcus dombrowskii]UOO96685.1 ATP-binding protein [Halococcus dombrowskii]
MDSGTHSGLVMETFPDSDLLIWRRNGDEETVKNGVPTDQGSESVKPGDVVRIQERSRGDDRAIEIWSQSGWSSGNTVGVVEDVNNEKAIVRVNDSLSTVTRVPDDVSVGQTIEITPIFTYHGVYDDKAVDIDDISPSSGGNAYDWKYEEGIDIKLKDIGGLASVKRRLREEIISPLSDESEDLRSELNISLSRGLLFHGKSGTGKTRTAKALSNHIDGELFIIGGPELVSKYYGETERQIRDIFSEAEQAAENTGNPSVIFLDELDSMAPPRGQADETERRIVAQLLSEMDGFDERGEIIVIGATNLKDEIDQAILRPGRFDTQLEFTLPDPEARESILKISLGETSINDEVDLGLVAEQTEGFTGADLDAIISQAKYLALKDGTSDIRMEHLQVAADRRMESKS